MSDDFPEAGGWSAGKVTTRKDKHNEFIGYTYKRKKPVRPLSTLLYACVWVASVGVWHMWDACIWADWSCVPTSNQLIWS